MGAVVVAPAGGRSLDELAARAVELFGGALARRGELRRGEAGEAVEAVAISVWTEPGPADVPGPEGAAFARRAEEFALALADMVGDRVVLEVQFGGLLQERRHVRP